MRALPRQARTRRGRQPAAAVSARGTQHNHPVAPRAARAQHGSPDARARHEEERRGRGGMTAARGGGRRRGLPKGRAPPGRRHNHAPTQEAAAARAHGTGPRQGETCAFCCCSRPTAGSARGAPSRLVGLSDCLRDLAGARGWVAVGTQRRAVPRGGGTPERGRLFPLTAPQRWSALCSARGAVVGSTAAALVRHGGFKLPPSIVKSQARSASASGPDTQLLHHPAYGHTV